MAHNKKRNTAFLYEALLREGTRAALEKDVEKIKLVRDVILENFNVSTELYKELNLFQELLETKIEETYAEKFVKEVESRYERLDKKKIFNEQTTLINKINKSLGARVYNSFVPNYKDLATISQIFNQTTPIKDKILLEQTIIERVTARDEQKKQESMQPIDNIVYKTFSKKFNEKYSSLLNEQKDLLTKFVGSFENDGLDLKIYLNEELERLKKGLQEALKKEEISSDQNVYEKTKKTYEYLKSFKEIRDLSQDNLQKILKIQQFVHEVNK
jgi:hypothetical protein